jgi:uncharacterized membrane protein
MVRGVEDVALDSWPVSDNLWTIFSTALYTVFKICNLLVISMSVKDLCMGNILSV